MKKKYTAPSIEVCKIETVDLLAASPAIGGNTGIGTGEGEPPTAGNAKQWLLIDDNGSAGIEWDD